jgi:hypothetical protein
MAEQQFLDLNVKVFCNKNNGQLSFAIPKKKIKKMISDNSKMPSKMPIRIYWGKK